jgi:hypothetical protein
MIHPDQKIKALVLTFDRHRAITQHMMLQYERVWPEHPFVFHIPYQTLGGEETDRTRYIRTPPDIRSTVLHLIDDLDDEEWIYWCMDDRYPFRLATEKISRLISHALTSAKMSGLLFCRCRRHLKRTKITLYRREWKNADGDIYLERRDWSQIWIHQLLRVKVLRYLFTNFPERLATGNQVDYTMDNLKRQMKKPRDFHLFVTKENFAVFGESTQRGLLTQNCFESIATTNIELPDWFRETTGERVTLGVM